MGINLHFGSINQNASFFYRHEHERAVGDWLHHNSRARDFDASQLKLLGSRGFHVISSKNRWAIRSGLRWSELIGVPTASIDVEQSCRLGPISAVASVLAGGVFNRQSNASHEE
jgi:hypothetical protein